MYFQNISKTTKYFFLVVCWPPSKVFKTFFEKKLKKIKFVFFVKTFEQFFFQRFFRFFEVCSSGDLVDFLGVCSIGMENFPIYGKFLNF